MGAKAYTILDLFCGAGGMSLGFRKAGFCIVQALDNFKPALETYRSNIAPHVAQIDLSQPASLPVADVIIGGPPCQGFSSAGLRRSEDQRNTLVSRFAQIIAEARPQAFIFENQVRAG